ncbi:hypothetical protein NECAME_09143 [Necator americanus]|uniref:Uncharacterized protein n=1 Tax=Necator americanus TaxID=51031 RepID=W2TH01_NECAM|nr:hypothetical protein NECAME_09143 [Necator americanus]ETN80471.1 hypothetical protein NECAME_09143 [Necator americanus]
MSAEYDSKREILLYKIITKNLSYCSLTPRYLTFLCKVLFINVHQDRNLDKGTEFAENVEIIYHPVYTNHHLQKTYATEGPRQPVRIKAANFLKTSATRLRNMAVEEAPTTSNSMDGHYR